MSHQDDVRIVHRRTAESAAMVAEDQAGNGDNGEDQSLDRSTMRTKSACSVSSSARKSMIASY